MKKKFLLFIAFTLLLSILLSATALAKTKLPEISKSKPLVTYTYASSGKAEAYTDSDLKTKTGGYISCKSDECKIISIKGNAVQVIYPVSGGKKTAWFSREDFTYRDLAKEAAKSSFTAKTSAVAYKWKEKSNRMDTISKDTKCYLLRGDEESEWLQIIYASSDGHKMGWIYGADYMLMTGKSKSRPSMVSIAKDEIGNRGTGKNGKGSGDYTKYGKYVSQDGKPWCASFVWWCADRAGISKNIIPRSASCDEMEKSKNYHSWDKNALTSLKENDVIFFSNTSNLSDSNHVGIVKSVDASKCKITIIEGNTGSDAVEERTYTVDSKSGKITKGYKDHSFCGYISVNQS